MTVTHSLRICGAFLIVTCLAAPCRAADEPAKPKIPEIADGPKTIDPATLMPEKLAAKATVDLSDSSLRELLDWLREERGLVVLLEESALSDIGVTLSEPISDRLNDDPVYLMLNRLRALNLGWYYSNDILHITTMRLAEERLRMQSYNIAHLLELGYDQQEILECITTTVVPDSWDDVGGPGVLTMLGDVLLVRQTDDIQRKIQGLMAALKEHGRQTFIAEPPQQLLLQEKLSENVSVDFEETPLVEAVAKLRELTGLDIRLDKLELRDEKIREREPVSISLQDRKLSIVLAAMLLDLKLRIMTQDGVLWITSKGKAQETLKTAVYDVRDLSRDGAEADSLKAAITSQARPDSWENVGGAASLCFPRPGTMVILAQDGLHMDVLRLLEMYRSALRQSKPREQVAVDPNEVITVYYRMHSNMAKSLYENLAKLVATDSWKHKNAEAPGTMLMVASPPDLESAEAQVAMASTGKVDESTRAAVVTRAVLIITQTRANHEKIAEVIRRVTNGDAETGQAPQGSFGGGGGGFGGGGGGGGFGGAYFAPAKDPVPAKP